MKDLETIFSVNLDHLYKNLPSQAEAKFLTDDSVLLRVFEDKEYAARLNVSLLPQESDYLIHFIRRIAGRKRTCGELRKELEGEKRLFKRSEEASQKDVDILKQMYITKKEPGDGVNRVVLQKRKYTEFVD